MNSSTDANMSGADRAAGYCAWPGSDEARRHNRTASGCVIAFMVGLGVLIGVLVAVGIAAGTGDASDVETAVPPSLYGGSIALALATAAAMWGWYGGGSAILRMNQARPVGRDEDPELFDVVASVARQAGVAMPRVFVIEDSALNACSTGRDPMHAALVVTRGLRGALAPAELRAVVAHEMVHIRSLDTRFALVMATMVGLIAFACDWLWRLAFQAARGTKRSTDSVKAGGWIAISLFVLAGLLSIGAPLLGAALQFFIRREREYRADAEAVELTGDPDALASALRKLAADDDPLVDVANRATAHLFIVNPLRRMRGSRQSLDSPFCSHPPMAKRIARLEELSAAMRARAAMAPPAETPMPA